MHGSTADDQPKPLQPQNISSRSLGWYVAPNDWGLFYSALRPRRRGPGTGGLAIHVHLNAESGSKPRRYR